MFKFFKEKLGNALNKITKKIEDEVPDEDVEIIEEVVIEKSTKSSKKEPIKDVLVDKLEKIDSEEKEIVIEEEIEDVIEEKVSKKKKTAPEERAKYGGSEVVSDLDEGKEPKEEIKVEPKKGFFKKIFKKKEEILPLEIETTGGEREIAEGVKIKPIGIEEIEEVETKGLLGKIKEKITTKKISAEKFEELFFELEVMLLENNVAFEVIEKIKQELSYNLIDKPIKRSMILEVIVKNIKQSIEGLFDVEQKDLFNEIKKKKEKPYVIVFAGVNGSGKTTTVAKFAHNLKEEGISCMLVAGDTWRAASIQQLEEHGKNIGIKVIKHDYGSDPAAVAFDGIKSAKSKNIDCVLIDTAGRQHSNKDLMREMEKIVRVAKPDFTIFVGESITGNDCVKQAQQFNESINIDGIILTKSDVDEKGGAAISISYVTGKPILYLGVGQNYQDLKLFDSKQLLDSLGL